jgi:hypothetical protein
VSPLARERILVPSGGQNGTTGPDSFANPKTEMSDLSIHIVLI